MSVEENEKNRSARSSSSNDPSSDPVVVSFDTNDAEDPHNWGSGWKAFVIFHGAFTCASSSMGSAICSKLITYLQHEFGVPSGPQTVLPASVYLVGYVLGPIVFAPMSENHGRRPVLVGGSLMFCIWNLASALAPNWVVFLFFRFLAGVFGSPPLSVMGGVIADVFHDPTVRGRKLMIWSGATAIGPMGAPLIAGYLGPYGWRNVLWLTFGLAVLSFISGCFLPETLASKILRMKAAKMNDGCHYIEPPTIKESKMASVLRPLHLLCSELILALTCLYLAFVYAVFYMMLSIFPHIFEGLYGLSPGESGAAFLITIIGTFSACLVYLWYDNYSARLTAKHPERQAEYSRLPVACLAAPIFVIALFWLGWTSTYEFHWIVPLMAMLPYGFAYQMIFISMVNYVADAYGIYAASALGASSLTRSLVGALLPLVTGKMLDSLGISWSCTVLAFVAVALAAVPFLFVKWGPLIRQGSKFSNSLQRQDGDGMTRCVSLV